MKTLLFTPIIFALIGWVQVSAQDSSDQITVPANELVTFSSTLNVTQCEGNEMSSSCSTSLPLISNQSLLLEDDLSSCDSREERSELSLACYPYRLLGEWLKSKMIYGSRYIGIISVRKELAKMDGVGEYSHYDVDVEILNNGKTVAKMMTRIPQWSQLPSVTLVAPSIERTTPIGVSTTTLSLSIGPSWNHLEPIPKEKSPMASSKTSWKLIKGQLR